MKLSFAMVSKHIFLYLCLPNYIHDKLVSFHLSGKIAFAVVLGKLEVLCIHDWRHQNSVILRGLAID